MKLLDTFAGIGGFSYAAEKLVGGFETTQFIEINPYCQKVLNKHWSHVPIHDDITTFTAKPGEFDIITGGFPCQDISVAGLQKGITKESRSGLFYELMRVIRMVRPKFIVLENVAAIINNGLDIVLGELSQAGYNAEWSIISASSLGACHRRSRWWLVAYPNSDGYQGQCFETRNKATPGKDLQIIRSTNTSDFERCSNDGEDKGKSRIDESLSRSSDRGKTISTETGRICDIFKETNDNQGISRENNNQENNDRALVQKRQSRVQLPEHTELGGDKTTLKNNPVRQGNENSSEQRMDSKESDVTNSYSKGVERRKLTIPKELQNAAYTWQSNTPHLSPEWQSYVSKSVLCRGDDGLRGRVDRLKALGNSVVPQVAAIPLQRIKDLNGITS